MAAANCINISDPEIQKHIQTYGEYFTAQAVDIYNDEFAEEPFTDKLFAMIADRVIKQNATKDTNSLHSRRFKDIEELETILQNYPEFLAELHGILDNGFNWQAIHSHVSELGKAKQISTDLETLTKDLVTTDDLKKIAKGIISHFHQMSLVLKALDTELKGLPKGTATREMLSKAYHASEIAKSFLASSKSWEKAIKEPFTDHKGNFLIEQLDGVIANADRIIRFYKSEAIPAIAEELASEMQDQIKTLYAANDAEIAPLRKELLALKQRHVTTKGETNRIKRLEKRIQVAEARRDQYASKENLQKAFEKSITGSSEDGTLLNKTDDISTLSYFLEGASLTNNIITGSVGFYLSRQHQKMEQGRQKIMADFRNLFEDIKDNYGKAVLTPYDYDKVYKPYIRTVPVYYVNEKGELVRDHNDHVLNTEMDEIGYQNELLVKKHYLDGLEKLYRQDPNDTLKAEIKTKTREIEKFRRDNEDRGYTEEYHTKIDSLPQIAKDAMADIIDEMRMQEAYDRSDTLSDAIIEANLSSRFKLDRLESLVNDDGTPKVGQAKEIAEAIIEWKKDKRAADLYTYEISKERRAEFDARLKDKKDALAEADKKRKEAKKKYDNNEEVTYEAVNKAEADYQTALKAYKLWAKLNTKREISRDFFDAKAEIIQQMDDIQNKYKELFFDEVKNNPELQHLRTFTEIWDDINNTLKGFRNKDSIFEGNKVSPEASLAIKRFHEELEEVRKAFKKSKKVSTRDKVDLQDLGKQLAEMQEYEETEFYEEAVKSVKAKIRVEVLIAHMEKNKHLKTLREDFYFGALKEAKIQFPAKTKAEHEMIAQQKTNERLYAHVKDTTNIEDDVQDLFEASEWFKNNHYTVEEWSPIAEDYETVQRPLHHWRQLNPTDTDYILKEEPTFRWRERVVNEKYIKNGKDGKEDFKFIPGRTQLRKSSVFRNDDYKNLTDKEEELLGRIHSVYQSAQQFLPKHVKPGLVLPSIQVKNYTSVKEALNPINIIPRTVNLTDSLLGKNDENEDQMTGSATNRMYMKYTRRMPAEQKSKNLLASLAMFAYEAEKFKTLYAKLPYFHAIEETLKDNRMNTKVQKMVANLFEVQLYGQNNKTLSNSKAEKIASAVSDDFLSLSAKLALSYRVPSAVKNWLAAVISTTTQANLYDLSVKDILAGMAEGGSHIHHMYMASVQVGVENDYIKKLRYFDILPDEAGDTHGKNVALSEGGKFLKVFPGLKSLSFIRSFLENDVRIGVFHAMAKKFTYTHEGEEIAFMDLYEIRDNAVQVKEKYDKDLVNQIESKVVGATKHANSLINGAYHKLDSPQLRRYWYGRFFMYMRMWFTYQSLRRFTSGRRIDYGSGREWEGIYTAVASEFANFFGNFSYNVANLNAYWETVPKVRRQSMLSAVKDTLVIATLMAVSYGIGAALYGDDDDEEEDGKYFMLYNLTYLLDEVETLHPVAGPWSMWYGRVQERTDKSAIEYYMTKNFELPYKSLADIYREIKLLSGSDVDLLDDYIQRSKSGNLLNPKKTPHNPALTGHAEITAYLLRMTGIAADINYFSKNEYQYRSYAHYNPKWYVPSKEEDLETVTQDINSLKNQIKTLKEQIHLTDDPETEERFREIISESKRKIAKYKKQKAYINQTFSDAIQDGTIE
jgi:hypothetical protein